MSRRGGAGCGRDALASAAPAVSRRRNRRSPAPAPSPAPVRSYPHALYFLDLLQTPEFRAKIAVPAYKELVHTQQFFYWQHARANRLRDKAAGGGGGSGATGAAGGSQQTAAAARGGATQATPLPG